MANINLLQGGVAVVLLLSALAAFDIYSSYADKAYGGITGAAVASTTITVPIASGWNMIGAVVLRNVISTTCTNLYRSAQIYNEQAHPNEEDKYDKYELTGETYKIAANVGPAAAAYIWNYGSPCSITGKLSQTKPVLKDGWNMVAIQPGWENKKVADMASESGCAFGDGWLFYPERSTEWEEKWTYATTDTTFTTQDVGRGFWVYVTGCMPLPLTEHPQQKYLRSNIFILEDDDTFNKDLVSITKKFYEKHPDEYDFISIHYKNGNFGGTTGFLKIKNAAKQGSFSAETSLPPGVNYADFMKKNYGTSGRLSGVIRDSFDFNEMYVKRSPNNSPIGLIDDFYFILLVHELTHFWGVNLPEELWDAQAESMATGGKDLTHWYYYVGSPLSGSQTTRQKLIVGSDGKYYFEIKCTSEPKHHDFDLYSMGLKSPEEIKEKLVGSKDVGYLLNCDTSTEIPSDLIKMAYTIQDFIKVLGPRIPSVAESQKDFTIAFVMIVPNGETLSQKQVDALNWIADKFPVAWYKSTEGRSTLNGIKPKDATPPKISNVKTSATRDSITVSWNTDEPSASFVIYTQKYWHLTFIYPMVITNPPTFSTTHNLNIKNSGGTPIDPNMEYPVKIISIDENYNMASFDAGTVVTKS